MTIFSTQLISAYQNQSWQEDAFAGQATPELDVIASLEFNFLAKVSA
ncbi:hypothetical protein [Rhodoferax sp.]|nr:hypothetical protein [Rhodoferax sp.]MDD3934813.1 hypothetical protein [Rhodoferax sp.]